MGFLTCNQLIKPSKQKIFVRPNYADVTTLVDYWIRNEKEMDKIVCMAGYSTFDDIAKITHVYTPNEERGKGYCKSIIYNLTKKLLEQTDAIY